MQFGNHLCVCAQHANHANNLAPPFALALGLALVGLQLAQPGHGQLDIADHGRDHLRLRYRCQQLPLARRQVGAALEQLHCLPGGSFVSASVVAIALPPDLRGGRRAQRLALVIRSTRGMLSFHLIATTCAPVQSAMLHVL